MGKGVNNPCNPGVILFMLRSEGSEGGKKAVIEDALKQCCPKCSTPKSNNNGGKTKRKMSWYNACIKDNGKEAMMTGECKKENLSDSEIEKWQQRADELNG